MLEPFQAPAHLPAEDPEEGCYIQPSMVSEARFRDDPTGALLVVSNRATTVAALEKDGDFRGLPQIWVHRSKNRLEGLLRGHPDLANYWIFLRTENSIWETMELVEAESIYHVRAAKGRVVRRFYYDSRKQRSRKGERKLREPLNLNARGGMSHVFSGGYVRMVTELGPVDELLPVPYQIMESELRKIVALAETVCSPLPPKIELLQVQRGTLRALRANIDGSRLQVIIVTPIPREPLATFETIMPPWFKRLIV